MQYPYYVHRDGAAIYRSSFADFPDADATGESIAQLAHNAQERLRLLYDDGDQLLPPPTSDTALLKMLEMDDGSGIWMFLEIDPIPRTPKSVDLRLNVPASFLMQVDETAKKRGLTRTAFLTLAARHELDRPG
jgi:predicted RNase H-like HicB family nuclease